MFRNRKPRSGKFGFLVEKSDCRVHGMLKWVANYDDPECSVVDILVDLYDNDIDIANIDNSGEWHLTPIGPISIDVTLSEIKKLSISGSAQQDLLNRFFIKASEVDKNFSIHYTSENRFLSMMNKDEIEGRYDTFFKVKVKNLIRLIIYGKENISELNTQKYPTVTNSSSRKVKISKECFQWIAALSGAITATMCYMFLSIDFYKLLIALFASITAWAAREAALVEEISIGDPKYSYQTHWRGSVWKLIGYISTAMVSVAVISGIHSGLTDQLSFRK